MMLQLKLKIWRQKDKNHKGYFQEYNAKNISKEMSFLEMLDVMNQDLIHQGKEPLAFDHDCREGICGSCSMVINGDVHGPQRGTTACQLHMRAFKNGETIFIEPWRAKAFPVIRDLVVDRSAFDRIMSSGGYISVATGNAQDANALPFSKVDSDDSFTSAACIGCGACVAACKNASAMLFVAAKVNHLGKAPQGKIEQKMRVSRMVAQMDKEGFGACTNTGSCSAGCPKDIPLDNIASLNRDLVKSSF